ncbi:MAG: energy transducer TonB [Nitrospirota bacterium]
MSLRRFFIYSFAVHLLVLAAILVLMPAEQKQKKGEDFFAKIISPEELLRTPQTVPMPGPRPGIKPSPGAPGTHSPVMKPAPSKQERGIIPGDRDTVPSRPPSPHIPSPPPSPEQRGDGRERPPSSLKPYPGEPSVREKLFDKKIIGDIAKRETEKLQEKEIRDTAITFDTKEYKFLIYNRRLKERIESIWIYPPDAAARGIYGDLRIRFTIRKNGQLGAVEITRTSGHKNLDDAAIKALRDGAPYWPLPAEWGMDAYTIEGHFIYTIYGYYIR